jgi:hypothetical protein
VIVISHFLSDYRWRNRQMLLLGEEVGGGQAAQCLRGQKSGGSGGESEGGAG